MIAVALNGILSTVASSRSVIDLPHAAESVDLMQEAFKAAEPKEDQSVEETHDWEEPCNSPANLPKFGTNH
jgi:hypothetical protein